MKQVILIFSVLAMIAFTGCGTKPGEAQADGAPSATPINVNGLPQATTPATGTTQPITAPDVTTPTTTTQPTTTTAAGKNPAHGAPGHRCDIEVGAPLNSPATTATPTPAITSNIKPAVQSPVITTTTPTVVPTATKTAPGMNPAHGQPGHRCEIAVGEPLNSKPAATTTATSTGPTVPVSTESIKPSIVNTTPVVNSTPVTTTTAVAPGMNPAHGQPGHRCEIAVGAPLNSKPEPLKNVTTPTEPKKDN